MSYCQFQNTSLDLAQILDVVEDACNLPTNERFALSPAEFRAFKQMLKQCELFLELASELTPTIED